MGFSFYSTALKYMPEKWILDLRTKYTLDTKSSSSSSYLNLYKFKRKNKTGLRKNKMIQINLQFTEGNSIRFDSIR